LALILVAESAAILSAQLEFTLKSHLPSFKDAPMERVACESLDQHQGGPLNLNPECKRRSVYNRARVSARSSDVPLEGFVFHFPK
jgi:hypothetical protein